MTPARGGCVGTPSILGRPLLCEIVAPHSRLPASGLACSGSSTISDVFPWTCSQRYSRPSSQGTNGPAEHSEACRSGGTRTSHLGYRQNALSTKSDARQLGGCRAAQASRSRRQLLIRSIASMRRSSGPWTKTAEEECALTQTIAKSSGMWMSRTPCRTTSAKGAYKTRSRTACKARNSQFSVGPLHMLPRISIISYGNGAPR